MGPVSHFQRLDLKTEQYCRIYQEMLYENFGLVFFPQFWAYAKS